MNRKAIGMTVPALLGLGLAAGLLSAAPATGLAAGPRAPAAQEPAVSPADWLHVQWGVTPGRDHSRITGYVYNDYGRDADRVQLDITALDASGRVASHVVQPVAEPVPALGRTYFDVKVPIGASYRVAVSAFTFVGDAKN